MFSPEHVSVDLIRNLHPLIPAQSPGQARGGIQGHLLRVLGALPWVPAFAGMSGDKHRFQLIEPWSAATWSMVSVAAVLVSMRTGGAMFMLRVIPAGDAA